MKTVISTAEAPAALGPYSQGIAAGPFVFCSGQIPLEMNSVYAKFFPDQPPARSTIQVAAVPKGANIEIEAVAVKPS
jgi:2-iminobutanoate/2-iminopropanoate deaminase